MSKRSGFSLLEILIVLSLVAIVSLFTIPSFKNIFEKNQQKIASRQLIRAIQFARSEAISLGDTVILSGLTDWHHGFVVRDNEKILFEFQNKDDNKLYWRAFPRDIDHLEFLANGFSNFENGTFWYCPHDAANPVWAVMLSQSGHTRIVYPDAQGKIIDETGNALGC